MSIVFVGTPQFAVPSLKRLAGDGHEISAVITQPDRPAGRGRRTRTPPVKTAGEELGLRVVQPASLRDAEALNMVAALNPEAIVAVAYGQILRQQFLDIPPRGVLNVHPSLLPKYRGASPVPAAILSGDEVTGVTIMLMDAGMDSGPILAQRPHAISEDDTSGSLLQTLAEEGAELLSETLPRWLAGEVEPRAQDESQATVTSLLKKEDGIIDWSQPAVELWRRVRAYNPWPGAHTHLDGEMLHIWRARPLAAEPAEQPGIIVRLSPEQSTRLASEKALAAFAVGTGDGVLVPLEVQREGRRRLSAAEFLRGMPDLPGKRLT
jgi:methionyl-tRNA formyltransferase